MRALPRYLLTTLLVGVVAFTTGDTLFAQSKAAKDKKRPRPSKAATSTIAPGGVLSDKLVTPESDAQRDFPALAIGANSQPVVAYIQYDGQADSLRLSSAKGSNLQESLVLSKDNDVYQPTLATDGAGRTWCFWSEQREGRWNLLAASVEGNTVSATKVIADGDANHVFADAKTDRSGRVWVTWQSFAGGHPDVFVRYIDPHSDKFSPTIQVTRQSTGDWEPRLAFGSTDEALIVFDTYRNGNFDVYLARVSLDGSVRLSAVAASDRYEARATAAAEGNNLWITYEDGTERWGKDLGSEWRRQGGGLQYDRHLYLKHVDLSSGRVSTIGDVTSLIPGLLTKPGSVGSSAINVPTVVLDEDGNPCLFFRYAQGAGARYWQTAIARYNVAKRAWSKAKTLANSEYCLDRRASVVSSGDTIYAAWASDGRKNKSQGTSKVHLTAFNPATELNDTDGLLDRDQAPTASLAVPVNNTPERDRNERHTWTFNGETYELYWGDVHRHTDFSVCRTTDDGCIVDHFRYAYEAGGLDYFATSDHTDNGKVLSDYEWWQTQKLADIFHNPGFFLGFYAYEREQKWPYGHRNVVFTERGGPIVYIKRTNYANSRWATPLPPQDGARDGEIPPWQLWKLLKRFDQRVITIEHTPGGGMGTNWGVYKQIDNQLENLVEIYQGSRESYEADGGPQPAVATSSNNKRFGPFAAGVYQNALTQGHRLGVFASSDHRSTNISYGGVYVKKFDRNGVFDGLDIRRTVAATDKIFMEFSCNGHMLGSIFETADKPAMRIVVKGTAPIEAVTIIRNETDYKVFKPGTKDFEATFTDDNPIVGENRYYVRVQQNDGNMGWMSPVWVTYKP